MQITKREQRSGKEHVTVDKKEQDSKGHHIFNCKTKKLCRAKNWNTWRQDLSVEVRIKKTENKFQLLF